MLGIGGKFAAAKGMVAVPNLANLQPSEADAVLIALGLRRGSQNSSSTSDAARNNKINTQTVAAGTLVDYETEVGYNYEFYTAPAYQPTVSYGACEGYASQSTGGWCSGTSWNYPIITTLRRRAVFYDGSFAFWSYDCTDAVSGGGSERVDGLCGYTAPVVCTGTAGSSPGSWGSCSGGQRCRTPTQWDRCGNVTTLARVCEPCCTAGLVSCTSWSGSAGGQSRVCTYRNSNCSTYTETETRCAATTTTNCGKCYYGGLTLGYVQDCTITTTTTSCTFSTRSARLQCAF